MDSTQKIISFCTGYGGIELGLKLAGLDVRTVAYVEIEAFACANLVAKIEQGQMDAAPIWTDIKTYPAAWFFGKIHGFVSGYPCQPFSNAGKRTGKTDPRHLWPHILKHIGSIEPLWCFFENVGGHTSLGFKEVSESLRDLGYSVEAGLFTAAEVGAPHKRERLFILAYCDGFDGRIFTKRWISERKTQSGSENVGHTGRERLERDPRRLAGHTAIPAGSGELANTSSRGGHKRVQTQDRPQRENGKSPTSFSESGNGQLADTGCIGQAECQEQSAGTIESCQRWPARPGQPQYEWEEPRTIKSGMGRTVDGFASRVDELRLLGNGVVPQTAALAWRTLTGPQ